MSRYHAELQWDGTRWSTLNVSDKPGLLQVYEPGYEEVPLEPGRPWIPVRHRWSYGIGRPGLQFQVLCWTDDHQGPAVRLDVLRRGRHELEEPAAGEEEPTATLERVIPFQLTPLERDVLLAYYSDFAVLPRPAILGPRSHEDAAHRLGRSRDSTRKAIERVNEKITRAADAPSIATGRNVSAEVGRWLARAGLIDPVDSAPTRPEPDCDPEPRATSFGTMAEDYDRFRPGPVAEVVEWLLPQHAGVVVDLGAGTGALTRRLVGRVEKVFSVEPDARMRRVLSERCPQATALEGRGDAIPLGDGTADAVLVSSAWHWMDVEPTLAEIARVLRSHGRLGVVWAGPDRSVPWFVEWMRRARDTSDLRDVVPFAEASARSWRGGERHRLVLPDDARFGPTEFAEIRWSRSMTMDDLVGLVGTYSGVITLPDPAREQLLQRARTWLQSQPELAAGAVDVPFSAACWRTDRLD